MRNYASSEPPGTASSKREAILRVAAEVFLAKGYEASSMDEIALAGGVARRTVYNHFESKRALFDATMSAMWARMPLDRIAEVESTQPPREVLREIGRMIAAFWAPPEALAFIRLVIWEGGRFPELADSYRNTGRGPGRHAVRDYVRRLSGNPAFKIDDPDLAARQFIHVVTGDAVHDRLVAGEDRSFTVEQREYIVDQAVELFLARYSVTPAAGE